MLSRVSELHSLLTPDNILLHGYTTFGLFIHWLMDILIVSTFWLLGIMLLRTVAYRSLCRLMFLFLMARYQGMKLLGQVLITSKVKNRISFFSI